MPEDKLLAIRELAAKELGLTLQQTAEITADGQVYGKPGAAVPPTLTKLVQTAFAMEKENQPQLAEVEAGKTFVIFDVTAITASAPATARSTVASSQTSAWVAVIRPAVPLSSAPSAPLVTACRRDRSRARHRDAAPR